jgi:uroporphyrin-III C-methyltransferase/precorrin-2 dehydrogenase/sirohydrochlorin ferrochelatase
MPLNSLPLFHRIAGQRVVVIGQGPAADAKRRLVERAGAECCGENEAHHARIAFVAADDRRDAESAALRLRSKGLLVNVTDRPELCDFTVPSVLERGPVVVAVGTGGASAALAKQLRLRLETLLPQSLGNLADALFSARDALRERWPDATDRRRALDAALTGGGPLDSLGDDAAGRVEAWSSGDGYEASSRTVQIVLTSGDPDDLTLRQARLLGEADAIVHEAMVPDEILARGRADAIRNPVGAVSGLTVVLTLRPELAP